MLQLLQGIFKMYTFIRGHLGTGGDTQSSGGGGEDGGTQHLHPVAEDPAEAVEEGQVARGPRIPAQLVTVYQV